MTPDLGPRWSLGDRWDPVPGKTLNTVIQEVLGEIITKHGAVTFDGNGYSAEWHAEAEKRGLPNFKTAVDTLPVLNQQDVITLFDKYKVLSPRELHGRYETYLEQYSKAVNVESKLTTKLAKTAILPGRHPLPAQAGRERGGGEGSRSGA